MSITLGDAVVYLISDDSELKAGLARAESLTSGFASNMAGSFQVAMGQLMAQAVTGLVTAVGDGVQAMGGFFAGGIEGAISLDAQLAGIAAKMGATKDEVMPLKDLIFSLSLDPNLVVNTTQAAEAIEMLAGNGAKMSDIIGGLASSTVALANATGNDFGLAAEVATSAMDLFGLKAQDVQKSFDGLVGVTTATKFGLNDMKLALSQSGAVFAGMGGDIKDFNTVIAGVSTSFASGSDAGTSFKTVLQRLTNPTAEMKTLMQQYNISLFDATGQMRPMEEVIGQLNQALYGQVTVTQSVGGATREQTKAAEDAAAKIPDLTYKISEQKEQLQFLSNQLFETRKWYAEGSDEVLKAKDKYDDMAKAIADNEGKLATYNGALETVSSTHATTTTSTKTLTEAERAHVATILGGADGARMLTAMGKMTEEQYKALSEQVNKSGLAFATAATQVDSVRGAFDIFWGVIEAVQLQLGDALLPLIRQMTEVFTVFASVAAPMVVNSFQNIANNITSFMQMVLPSVAELNQAFKDGGIDGMLKVIGDNILGLLIPMGDAKDGFAEMNATLNDSRAAIAAVIGLPLTAFLTDMANAFKQGGIDGVLQDLSDKITTGIPRLISNMGQSLLNGASTLLSNTTQLLQSIPQAMANFAPNADEAQRLGANLAQAILSAFGMAVSSAESVSSPLGAFFSALGAAAMSMSGVLFEVATNVASGFLAALQERFTTIDVSGIFGGLMGALGGGVLASAFTSIATAIAPLAPLMPGLLAGFTELGAWAVSVGAGLSGLLTYLGGAFTALYTAIASSSTVATLGSLVNLALAPMVAQLTALGATITAYMSAFAAFGGWLGSVVMALPGITPLVTALSTAFTFMAGAVTPFMGFLAPFGVGIASLSGAFALLINPITLAGAAIIALGALWGTNFEQINAIAKQAFDYLVPTFDKLREGFNGFIQNLGPSLPAIQQLFNTFIEAIPSMQIIVGVIGAGLVIGLGKLGDVLAAILPSLGTVIGGLVTGLSGALSGAIQFVDGAVQMLTGLLTGDLDQARQGALDVLTGLVEGVTRILAGLSVVASGIMTGLAEGIQAAIPALGTSLTDMVNYIVDTFKGLLGINSPSTVFAEFGLNLVEGLIEGVSSAAGDLAAIFEELATASIEALGGAWDELVTLTDDTMTAIADSIDSFASDAGQLWDDLASGFDELWSAAWDAVATTADNGIGAIYDILDGFASDAASTWDSLSSELGELWATLWDESSSIIDDSLSNISDLLNGLYDEASSLWDSLSSEMGELWASLWETVGDLTGEAVDTVSGYLNDLYDEGESLWTDLTDTLSSLWEEGWAVIGALTESALDEAMTLLESFADSGLAIWDGLTSTLQAVWSMGWEAMSNTFGSISNAIGAAMNTLGTTLSTAWEIATTAMSTVWGLMWTAITTAYDTASNAIGTGIDSFTSTTSALWETMSGLMSTAWDKAWELMGEVYTNVSGRVKSSITEFADTIESAITTTSTNFGTIWNEIWDNSYKKLQSASTSIINEIKTWLKQAADTFANAKDDWVSAGADMFEGIKKGILSKRQELEDLLFAMAMGALRAAKRALGIESPSKEFAEVGAFTMEGWMGGISDNAGMVTSAVTSVGEGLITAATDSVGGLGGAISGAFQNAFQGIFNNDFGAMLGGGTRQVIAGVEANMSAVVARAKQNVLSAKDMRTTDEAKRLVTESLNELNNEYGKMLQSGVAVDEAIAKYNDAAQKIKESYKPVSDLRIEGQKNVDVDAMVAQAMAAAQKTAEAQRGIGDVFDLSATATKERLQASFDAIIATAKKGLAEEAITFGLAKKEERGESLERYGDIALKGVGDSVKAMVSNVSEMLAQGLNPSVAMKEYVEKTSEAFNLLNSDIMSQLPSAQAEGKALLNEGYKDILAKLDTDFIGKTKAALSGAGKLFKEGLADGLNLTDLMKIFNESVAEVKATTEDTFIKTMPGTISRANELLDDEYRKMKDALEKGLNTNIKDGLTKASQAFTDGLKKGIDPKELMAGYQTTITALKNTLTTDLTNTIPDAVDAAGRTINDAYTKLSTSLQKDFVGGVKTSVSSASEEFKKTLSNMADPKQAVAAAASYLGAISDIKAGFSTGLGEILPEGVAEAQRLISENSDKAAADLGKNFIKMVKEQYKDAQAEIKKGLESGIDPSQLVSKFQGMGQDMTAATEQMRLTLTKTFGIDLPKDFADLNGLFGDEFGKVTDTINKAVTGDMKTALKQAETLVKDSFKQGLPFEQITAQYDKTIAALTQQANALPIGELVTSANTLIGDSMKSAMEAMGKGIKDTVGDTAKAAQAEFSKMLSDGVLPQDALAKYKQAVTGIGDILETGFIQRNPALLAEGQKIFDDNFSKVVGSIEKILGKEAKDKLKQATTDLKEALSNGMGLEAAKAAYEQSASAITDAIKTNFGDQVPNALREAGNLISGNADDVTKILEKSLLSGAKDKLAEAKNAIKEGLKDGLGAAEVMAAYQTSISSINASLTTDLAQTLPNAVADVQNLVKANMKTAYDTIGKEVLGGVKDSLGGVSAAISDAMKFGGSAEGLAAFNESIGAVKAMLQTDLAGSIPGLIDEGTALIAESQKKMMKTLGDKFYGELKGTLKAQADEVKAQISQGIDPATALGNFQATMNTVMGGLTTDMANATPGLSKAAGDLVTNTLAELGKLTGADVGGGLVKAVSQSEGKTNIVNSVAQEISNSLPNLQTQSDTFLIKVGEIGNGLIALISGEGGFLPQIGAVITTATKTINPIALGYGQSISNNFSVGLNAQGLMDLLSGELGLLPQINLALTTATTATRPIAFSFGEAISMGMAQGVEAGARNVYEQLDAVVNRTQGDMMRVSSMVSQQQLAAQQAFAAIGQAAQTVVNNANNTVSQSTVNNNNNVNIYNPVSQPAERDLRMVMTLM